VAEAARVIADRYAIRAAIGDEIARYRYTYPGRRPIQLIFFSVTEFEGDPVNIIFEQIRWEKPANLPAYDFLDGDVEFVKRLYPLLRRSDSEPRQ